MLTDECYMLTANLKRRLGLYKIEELDLKAMCHGVPLENSLCKVSIINCCYDNEVLPGRHPDGDTIGESVGTFVAWPKERLKKVCRDQHFITSYYDI